MKPRRNVQITTVALTIVVLLAGGGWVAARQIRSPARVAADTAPPSASLLTAQVERRALSTEVIVRGTGRYGKPQAISLPSSALKTSTQVISRIAKPDQVLHERSRAMTVSGRPVFVLRGATPMHRDIGPGDRGEDVHQLESALVRFGYAPGAVDGRYDGATAAAVAQMYRDRGAEPFGLTEAQIDRLNTAAQLASSAADHLLQMRLALRTAKRGVMPADVNQARLDALAVAELLPPARAAIVSARVRMAEARDLESTARRLALEGDGAARRDVATARVDVAAKRSALSEALTAQAEAQRALDRLPPDAPPSDVEAARSQLRITSARVPGVRTELEAAETVLQAAEIVVRQSSAKASDDGRKAARDFVLARADLREAERSLDTLRRKQVLAAARVRILLHPADTNLEREIVAASAREAARARADHARLAGRSGIQVPADEILFFPSVPVRVDTVTAKRGSQVGSQPTGDLMTVSNTTLAIDSGLSPQDAELVRTGMRVRIEDSETGIDLRGRVTRVADRPGTNPQLGDPTKTAFEVTPEGADARLVNTSVRLTIAISSTKGEVLTVPLNALSIGADGRSRVQLDMGAGRTRLVAVNPGLAAAGNVAITPARPGAIKRGDRVVIGARLPSSARKAATNQKDPRNPTAQSGAGAGTTVLAPALAAPWALLGVRNGGSGDR